MSVPVSQMVRVVSYILARKLRGEQRYPLVLMLEPLFRCNLACAGCGKIQYPSNVLKTQLSFDECMRAAEECPTPIVSIPGGEPLLHPEIARIVSGLVARKRYVYLCTNALLLEEKLSLFAPSKYLTFSVHLDGMEAEHDDSVCREGTYRIASRAIELALARGFRVTTNTTLFDNADPDRSALFFDELMKLGVEGMTISPGYSYEKAPDQGRFLKRDRTIQLFRRIFAQQAGRGWRFNQSPLFLEFLTGARSTDCRPWGNPTFSVFGWQKPCYLLQEGYADSFQQLIDETRWEDYGHASGNPSCADCMVHSGFEASAVDDGFSSLRGFAAMARAAIFGPRTPAPDAALPAALPLDRPSVEVPYDRGWTGDADPEALRAAFDYRGNVTLELENGRSAEGFVVNLTEEAVHLWRKGTTELHRIARAQIRGLSLSGRNMAAAERFEARARKRVSNGEVG